MKQETQPDKLQGKLLEVWRRHQTLQSLLGTLVLFKWTILLLVLCVILDWQLDLPGFVRAILILAILTFAALKAWRLGWVKLKAFDPAQIALKVEEHFGNLKSLLVSAVQFSKEPKHIGALQKVTVDQAQSAIKDLPTKETVSFSILRRPSTIFLILLAAIAILGTLNKPFLSAALSRFFTPWSEASYPTRTQLILGTGDITVKEGSPITITAKIAGIIPSNATISLRTNKGAPRDHQLKIKNDSVKYKVTTAFRNFEYQMTAGDKTSAWHQVTVIEAPKITAAKTTIKYPSYTNKKNARSEALTLTAPEGSIVQWQLKLDRAVSKASFDSEDGKTAPMNVSADGKTVSGTYTVTSSCAYHFSWQEKSQGYNFKSSNHFLQVAPDNAPRVELITPSENLYAIVGRKIDLSFIARDDFGISETSIIYHLNNNSDKAVKIDSSTIKTGTIHQSNWDYRSELKNIKVGDILRIGVEVKDHFPSKAGPNKSRSRMRRVTFMTEAEYVKQIENRKLRLLKKLRSIYRQSRASYTIVSNLKPSSKSFQQTALLEGVRQDLLTERMKTLVDRIAYLIGDIEANKIKAAVQTKDLQILSKHLQQISNKYIKPASSQLRELAHTADLDNADIAPASLFINTGSREIASLVLKLGVQYATEVLARELQTAIQIQTELRLKSIDLADVSTNESADSLATSQNRLASYINLLFSELLRNPDYTNSAMATLRLSRIIKDIRSTKLEKKMTTVASLLKNNKYEATIEPQEEILNILKTAVYRLTARAEMNALRKARESIQTVLLDDKRPPAERYAILRTVILPKIPAPRQSMASPTPPTNREPANLFKELLADIQKNTPDHQKKASEGMKSIIDIINLRIKEMSQFGEFFTLMMDLENRSTKIKTYLVQQNALLEETEDALDEEESITGLVNQQKSIGQQIKALVTKIKSNLSDNKFTGFASALTAPLTNASDAMLQSAKLINKNAGDESIEKQEEAVAALNAALAILNGEAQLLSQVINIINTEQSISTTARYFADIGAEQKDIVTAGKGATPEQLAQLALAQKNLARTLPDVIASLAGPTDSKDMASLIEFSQSSFGSASLMLAAGKQSEAVASQTEAANLLNETSEDIRIIAARNIYVAEMMEFLYRKSSEAMNIFAAQKQLNFETQYSKNIKIKEILTRQTTLSKQAKKYGDDLARVTKQGHFQSTFKHTNKSITLLKKAKLKEAIKHMKRAEGAINVDQAEFSQVMAKLINIPGILPAELNYELKLMLDVLDLSISQQQLTRKLWLTKGKPNKTLLKSQVDNTQRLDELMRDSGNHPMLIAAHKHLTKSANLYASSSKKQAYHEQRSAEGYLRGFVIEYAHTYVWLGRGNGRKKSPFSSPFKKDDIAEVKQLDDFDIFQKVAVEGELPDDKKSEWEVLGRRERDALNENFARELPLEYRDLLKDYYESLAK